MGKSFLDNVLLRARAGGPLDVRLDLGHELEDAPLHLHALADVLCIRFLHT